ncbi:MAG: DUF2157 domain-containing protein [Gallionella sp.]|nr:DUF2157 domain-containing protein [Gallionella sp.]MDD4947235.1 DUF2157 domain-containing protein [Gallionella sp.]
MNITMQQAQQRAEQIQAFRNELVSLEQEGVLTLDAAERQRVFGHQRRLLDDYTHLYDIDRSEQASQLSLGMRIASLFGALALSASVFFLFHQFWGNFSTTVQVAVLAAAPLLMLAATVLVQRYDASGYFAKLVALVAFACFVLDVTMLGQIYNITPSDKALLPWAALAFLLAYACRVRLLLVVGILCVDAYIAARVGTWGGIYWLGFGERPESFFPAAALLLLAPAIIRHRDNADFPPMYRVFGLLTLFLPMLVMSNWGESSYLDWDADAIEGMYQLAGFVGSVLVIWLGVRLRWNEVVNTGVTFFVIFLYTKLFDWWWETMPKYQFFLLLGLIAVLVLLVLKRLRSVKSRVAGEAS